MGTAGRLIVCWALALVSASASAQSLALDAAKFNSALSCRLSKISGGQRSTAAIYEDAPDSINPLRLIRMSAGAAGSELETITPRKNQIIIGHLGSIEDKFYWTPADDLVVWGGNAFLHLPTQGIRVGSSPRFHITFAGGISLMFLAEEDVIPEHIRTAARIVGRDADRSPLQFEPATGNVSYLPVPVDITSTVAWTQDDDFVRLRTDYYRRAQQYLEVFESTTSEWLPLTPAAMPKNSILVLVRKDTSGKALEAVIRWRESGVDRVGIVKHGAQQPEVIASAKSMTRVLVSPDRSRVYGFVDVLGRFHRLATETQKPGVVFWLTQMEKKQELEKVSFLSDAKFALIKARGPVAGPEVQLLERRGSSVAVRHTFCSGGAEVARVAEREHSILFVPKGADARKLLVYLHDGPAARVDRGGNWLIDLLLASGHPVIAVNYTGSLGREPVRAETRGPAEIFGGELARAIVFARGELSAGEQTVVLVGEGFGALVGFSALSSQKVKPSGFAVVSGLAKSEPILSAFQSDADPTFRSYGRMAREAHTILDPSKIRASHPQLEFLFVHSDKDRRTSSGDITKFAQQLTPTNSGRPAVAITHDTYDAVPYRRAHYDQIAKAIGDFLARQ